MKSRHKRMVLVGGVVLALALSAWFVLSAFQQNLVFFFTPTQVQAGEAPVQRSFRIGGMVESGSLVRGDDGVSHAFVVTDMAHRVRVSYKGLLPDLFKEGKGVVAQGRLDGRGQFVAEEVLAKHDENYMPPQAAYALERAAASAPARTPGQHSGGRP